MADCYFKLWAALVIAILMLGQAETWAHVPEM